MEEKRRKTHQALRARKEFIDGRKVLRQVGEEWLVRETGVYMPDVNEEIRDIISAYVLTEKKALQLEALRTFTNVFGKQRKTGEQWFITLKEAETYYPNVNEKSK